MKRKGRGETKPQGLLSTSFALLIGLSGIVALGVAFIDHKHQRIGQFVCMIAPLIIYSLYYPEWKRVIKSWHNRKIVWKTTPKDVIIAPVFVILYGAVAFVSTPENIDSILTRIAFSKTETIKVLPPSLGGNDTLDLDNVASLKQTAPYSDSMVTMILDTVPLKLPDHSDGKTSFEGAEIYDTAPGTEYVFDMDKNKRHEIKVSGRTFIVKLSYIQKLDMPSVAYPIEYVFGISEK